MAVSSGSTRAMLERTLQAGPAECTLSAGELREARRAVADIGSAGGDGLRRLAQETYKQCVAMKSTDAEQDDLPQIRLRALCLLVYQRFWGERVDEAELVTLSKHWVSTAVQFMVGYEPAESRIAIDTAAKLLAGASGTDPLVIEVRCRLKGTEAQLQWVVGNPRATIEVLEGALALVNKLGTRCPPSTRRFLADNIALSLACAGHNDADEEDTSTIDRNDAPMNDAPTDRRLLIRLTDLSLSLLGDGAADEEVRDRALRLRAWLCMLEDELDMAAQSLQRHSGGWPADDDGAMDVDSAGGDGGGGGKKNPTFMLLRLALQLKTSQKAEACSQAIKWLTSDASLPFERVRDTIDLLCRNDCGSAALEAASAIVQGRLATACDPAASRFYSDITELQYRLLTQGPLADSSAAASLMERVLEAHAGGQQLAAPETLRRFARKLWNSGCMHADAGQLHHAIEDIERANRFLEEVGSAQAELASMLSTLAHFYLSVDRFEDAADRASRALALLQSDASSEATRLELPGQAEPMRSQGDPVSLSHIVLIKANLRLGLPDVAREHIDSLLAAQPPHDCVLIGAICEDIAAMGPGHEAAVVALLERFIALLESAPHGAAEQTKLAGAVRSLITYREAQHKHQKSKAPSAAEAAEGLLRFRTLLLTDLRLVARRASQLGACAVCEGATHIEWLAQRAWNDGVECAKAGTTHELGMGVNFLEVHAKLLKALDVTDARREAMLRSQLVIVHISLALHDQLANQHEGEINYGQQAPGHQPVDADAAAAAAGQHLQRATDTVAAAFRLRQRCNFEPAAAPGAEGGAGGGLFQPDVSLCLLNFGVGLRRRDPSLNALLSRASETSGVQVCHFVAMAEAAYKVRNAEMQRAALEHALRLLMATETRDYAGVALLLRRLIHACSSREEQLPHFLAMAASLAAYSAANCPLDADLLQWYLSSSYNLAVAYFNDKEPALAEKWFSVAFKFLHLAPPSLQSSRDELMQSYDLVMKEIAASSAYGHSGGPAPSSFYARMKGLVTRPTTHPVVATGDVDMGG